METDIASWGLFAAVVLGFVFLGIWMIKARLDRMRAEEELAEMEFQQTVLATFNQEAALGDDSRFIAKTDAAEISTNIDTIPPTVNPAVSTESKSSAHFPAPESPLLSGEPLPADLAAAAVMKQLEGMNLVTGVDGYVALHGNPKGAALLRLRTGKKALLVPHMESESFLRHNARRADMIIMTGTDGKAFVVSPLEQFLAESFDAR